MESIIEKEMILPKVAIQLATIEWDKAQENSPFVAHYCVCQRLSENHAPLRIGNINAREAFPRPLSVGFLPPGCAARLYPIDGPLRVLNCAFEKSYFEEIAEIGQHQWEEYTHDLVAIRDHRLELLMQEIYGELVQPNFGSEILIESASTMILLEMSRYGRCLRRDSKRQGTTGQILPPRQLKRIHDRIYASAGLGFPSIEELAQLCGISQSRLMRSFKTSTGWPIHKYVAEQRLNAAKQMLTNDAFNSKEIASKLGFRSAAYFATAFRRMTGKTPTEYRRQARAKDFDRD